MKTIELIESIRVYLGRPAHDTLDNGSILTVLFGRIDHYRSLLGLTDENWLIKDMFLNVDANSNEYTIAAGDFSRPIKVELYNDQNPSYPGPEIPIVRLQDTDLVGGADSFADFATTSSTLGNDGAYVASGIAFYGIPVKVRIIPRPYQAVTYRIYYEPTVIDAPALLDEPALQGQFHNMLAIASATLCLPICRYDPDVYSQFAEQLTMERQRLEKVFDDFRKLSKHSDTRRRRPFRPSWNRGYK